MQFSQFSVCIGAVTAHHQISDHLYIMFFQHQNIGTVQSLGIFDLNKYTGLFVTIQQGFPCSQCNPRCGNIYFAVNQRI